MRLKLNQIDETRLIWIFPSFVEICFADNVAVRWSAAIQLRLKWIRSVRLLLLWKLFGFMPLFVRCCSFFFVSLSRNHTHTQIARTGRERERERVLVINRWINFQWAFSNRERVVYIQKSYLVFLFALHTTWAAQSTENQLKELCFYCSAC